MRTAATWSTKRRPWAGHDPNCVNRIDDPTGRRSRDETVRPCPTRRDLPGLPANPTGALARAADTRPRGPLLARI